MGVEGRGEPRCSEASLFAASSFVTASGGGKGDIETLEMDAECARQTRSDFNEGTDSACY